MADKLITVLFGVAVVGTAAFVIAKATSSKAGGQPPPGNGGQPPPGEPHFVYVSSIRQSKFYTELNRPAIKAEIDVKNTGTLAGTCSVDFQKACAEGDNEWQSFVPMEGIPVTSVNIDPGQTFTFWNTSFDSPAYGYTCKIRVSGSPGISPEVPMI